MFPGFVFVAESVIVLRFQFCSCFFDYVFPYVFESLYVNTSLDLIC